MAQKVLLINRDDIMSYTSINGNVDFDKLTPHVYNAQIMYLENSLGSALYDALITLVDNGNISSATYANYSTLLYDYVTPFLVFSSMEQFIDFHGFEIANGGIYRHQTENSVISTKEENDGLSQNYRNIANKYLKLLETYLYDNSTLFSELTAANQEVDRTTDSTFRGGFYLGNTTNSKYKYGTYYDRS